MTPEQFLVQLRRQDPAPVYLFFGAEPYRKEQCRRALAEIVLGKSDREQSLVRYDLQLTPLAAVVDDARSLSLFTPRRLIWATGAEAALPRGRTAASEEDSAVGSGPQSLIAEYLRRPSPGVVVVLEASRYETEGEDKAKLDRVRKYYSVIPAQVEFPPYTVQEARQLADGLAKAAGLNLPQGGIEALVESLGADAMRISTEIEKLSLYTAGGRRVESGELSALVPESGASTIFALVDALGRKDRMRSLELVNVLIRQGEYMPLALSFLATLFRLALAAKEQALRNPQQIQHVLSKPGRPVWRSRAEQIHQTATVFTRCQLQAALIQIFATDKGLRDARPSDRIVMEEFILGLTD